MDLQSASKAVLVQLHELLQQLRDDKYAARLDLLSGSSIGQHTRHILEFYIAIMDSCEGDIVSYDKRKRNPDLENLSEFAMQQISSIDDFLNSCPEDKIIKLEAEFAPDDTDSSIIRSGLFRELLYCLEHAIHHMAIVRIAVQHYYPSLIMEENFGIAPSTVKYRQAQCAQ